ncbi:hypothetical protein C7293_13950 [filamentous cyanobacterium CCT1]|nr:hypothetical protein C7293_13950 [filamentous cyanobacterium CCT1]PSN79665.1 hypothetical protein C8B47_10565 [filamentous cyanobacterium CCP4]
MKRHYQPEHRSRSWLATVRIQRLDIADLLDDNPSPQPYLAAALDKAYRRGIELACEETNLPGSAFPAQCPYSLVEALDAEFFPGEPSDLVS